MIVTMTAWARNKKTMTRDKHAIIGGTPVVEKLRDDDDDEEDDDDE